MSEKFNGFTEDDIKKLNSGIENGKYRSESVTPIRQTSLTHPSGKRNVSRERLLQNQNITSSDVKISDIPDGARLCVQKNPSNVEYHALPKKDNDVDSSHAVSDNSSECPSVSSTPDTSPSRAVCLRIKEGGGYEVLCTEKDTSILLDDFQTRQKLMEEQNRQRKTLLAKALADRKKKTHEEVKRLQHIQEELQKLDIILSNDVSVLRNEIEGASIEFMEAQKRYNKAEKEFLEAKLCLFHKLERKELLTEHLYRIIEQNELRKAQKLSELMEKLELGSSVELTGVEQENFVNLSNPIPVYNLDEVTYAACNTLKSRTSLQGDSNCLVTVSQDSHINNSEHHKDTTDISTGEITNNSQEEQESLDDLSTASK